MAGFKGQQVRKVLGMVEGDYGVRATFGLGPVQVRVVAVVEVNGELDRPIAADIRIRVEGPKLRKAK